MRKLMFLLAATAIWPVAAQAQIAGQPDEPHRHRGDAQVQDDSAPRPERGDRQRGGGEPQAQVEAQRQAPTPNVQPEGGFRRGGDQGNFERRRPPEMEAQQGWADRQRQVQPDQGQARAWRDRQQGGQVSPDWTRQRDGGQARPDGSSWQDRQQRQGQWQNRGGGWNDPTRGGQNRHVVLPPPNDGRIVQSRDRDHRWGRDWRQDRRYDWRDYRTQNRFVFRLGNYYDPYRYQYRRWQVGFNLWPAYYQQDFWLDDPWMYRLPPAYGPYRWVRYWDDALLVNIYTGQVVDVVYNVFW